MSPNAEPRGPGRSEDLGTFEMIWDCKFCGTQGLPAKTHRFCPNCGAAQDTQTRRFPSDAEKIAVANYVSKGASRICPACSTPNEGDAGFCVQCGSPLDAAARAKTLGSEVRAENASFAQGAQRDLAQERLAEDLGRSAAPARPAGSGLPTKWIVLLVALAVVVCGGIIAALTWQRAETAVVIGHQWQRVIEVESYSAVRDSTWQDQVPYDAYSMSCSQRQRTTRQVPDGEDCSVRRVDNGDGTFSERRECVTTYRDEPVYDDYCTYTVNRWVPSREVTASGRTLGDTPRWPTLTLVPGSGLGAEREGGRDEEYVVLLRLSGDKTAECRVNQDAWQRAAVERTYEVSVGVITGQTDCSALERADGS